MKNDYRKNNFWTKLDPITKQKTFYLNINDVHIEVPENVYRVCFNSYMKMLRASKLEEVNGVLSLDFINADGNSLIDTLSAKDIHNETGLKDDILGFLDSLGLLDSTIMKLYLFEEMTHCAISKELSIPKSTISYRIDKNIKSLRKFLEKLVV